MSPWASFSQCDGSHPGARKWDRRLRAILFFLRLPARTKAVFVAAVAFLLAPLVSRCPMRMPKSP